MRRISATPAIPAGATSVSACALGVVLACSGSSAPPPPAPAAMATSSPPAAPGDAIVARVNGRPVWASCIAAQAGSQARAALDDCIAFELLAQAAEARGIAGAPEVDEATRSAAVSRLVETAFEARYRSPADLPAEVDAAMQRNAWRMHILELRASTFARFVVPARAPQAIDDRARGLAEQLAAEFTGQTGLYGVHLTDAARRIAAADHVAIGTPQDDAAKAVLHLEHADVRPMHQDDLVAPYAQALYAIPDVGQSSRAFRTQWGWDVIVWTGGGEAKERTRDEVVAELFPELRRRQFSVWVTGVMRKLRVQVELDDENLKKLDEGQP